VISGNSRQDSRFEEPNGASMLVGSAGREQETALSGRISSSSDLDVPRGAIRLPFIKPLKRHWKAVIVVGGAAFILLHGALGSQHPTIAVHLASVHPANFQITIPATGEIQRPRIALIPTLVGGNIGELLAHAGMRVHAGRLLATVENPELQSNLLETRDAYLSTQAHANSIAAANAALPAEHRATIEQAQVAVMQARAALTQAQEDQSAGVQSGPGYGTQTAEQQRLDAQAAVKKAANELNDAERIYKANQDLFVQKAISRDTLEQSRIRFENATAASTQALTQHRTLEERLTRVRQVLSNGVHTAENQVRQAQAALDAATAKAAGDAVGDVQAANADAARAKDAYLFASEQVSRTQIVAPFDGTIQRVASEQNRALRPLVSGDPVQTGEALFTIATSSGFLVRADIDEQDIAQVRIGDRAIVSGEDFGDKKLTGRVTAISPTAERSNDPSNTARQVEATIALDGALPFLRDGMSVNADIVTTEIPHALAVPNEAIRRDGERTYAFIVRDGRAVKRFVTTGRVGNTQTVIVSGLHDGDSVVADNDARLLENVGVTPK